MNLEYEILELTENLQTQQRTLDKLQSMLRECMPKQEGKGESISRVIDVDTSIEWLSPVEHTRGRRRDKTVSPVRSSSHTVGGNRSITIQRAPWNGRTFLDSSPSQVYGHQTTSYPITPMKKINVINHFPVASWEGQWGSALRSPPLSPRTGRQSGDQSPVREIIKPSYQQLESDNTFLRERCKALEGRVKGSSTPRRQKHPTHLINKPVTPDDSSIRPRWNAYSR